MNKFNCGWDPCYDSAGETHCRGHRVTKKLRFIAQVLAWEAGFGPEQVIEIDDYPEVFETYLRRAKDFCDDLGPDA